ncbi:MAG: ATP-binding protein [Acidobacteriia bacterium]|nr:ATP-binding protein [Terriglobia bacterium]MBV8906765.1 ATP-binding protein [Terriglobia bacterium]
MQRFIEDADDGLLMATRAGLRRLIDGRVADYSLPRAYRKFIPLRPFRDRDGGLWIGTLDGGLLHEHQGITDRFAQIDGLSGDWVRFLFEDREGNVWAGTFNGLDRFRNYAVATATAKQGLSNSVVQSVLAAKDGSVWIATFDGLNRWKGGQITIYSKRARSSERAAADQAHAVREIIDPGLPEDIFNSILEDRDGAIWAGGLHGLASSPDGRFVPVKDVVGSASSIVQAADGKIWMSEVAGLDRLEQGRLIERIPWTRLGRQDHAETLAPDPVRGGLWLGFFRGDVAYFKDGKIQASYSSRDGLGAGMVVDLKLDRNGTLWAATQGGLSSIKDGRIATLTSKNGLPCDTVHWMIEDNDHSVWLYTTCGLVRMTRSELDGWSATPGKRVEVAVFDAADGVRTNATVTGAHPLVSKTADGRIWFASGDGVSFFDPRHMPVNQVRPPVHIERIKADGKVYEVAQGVRLPTLVRDVWIDYTALSLVAPEKTRFRYKLEGQDRDWKEVVNDREAQYSNLAPRHYRFRVMAANNSGVWNEAGDTLDFAIDPAFYQATWFRVSAAAAVLAMLALAYQLRLRYVKRQFAMRTEERVNERTRIARDLHDTLLQSLAGVSLQLDGISKQAATHPEKTPPLIGRVREQVDYAFREARVKVWNLRSPTLEGRPLAAALCEFVERTAPASKARCGVTVSGHARPCTPEVEEELLRIAQEATNNAIQHAEASEIRIALEYHARSLTLSICDDGRGFDWEEGYRKSGHWGLKNIGERAALVRGTCKTTTAPGQGTRVEVSVPLSSWFSRNTLAKHANSNSGS